MSQTENNQVRIGIFGSDEDKKELSDALLQINAKKEAAHAISFASKGEATPLLDCIGKAVSQKPSMSLTWKQTQTKQGFQGAPHPNSSDAEPE